MIRLLIIVFLFISAQLTWAQQAKTVLSKSEVEVGEKITLTYLLLYNQENDFRFNSITSHIPYQKMNKDGIFIKDSSSLELLSSFKDTIIKEPNQQLWTGIFEFAVWDTGTYKIPEISIKFKNESINFPSALFKAQLVEKKDSTEFYDIKEEFAEIPKIVKAKEAESKSNSYWWLLVWVALVVFAFVLIRWILKKKPNPHANDPLDIQKQTIKAILELEKKQLWLQGKEKEHYSELSFHLRSYFSYCFELNLLEKTTLETVLLLKQLEIEPSKINEIQALLNGADLVKFAKSKPREDRNLELLERARLIVQNTKPLNVFNAE